LTIQSEAQPRTLVELATSTVDESGAQEKPLTTPRANLETTRV
jgi:hypothetical protein